ncbi:hypothetical protein LINGRAHAP2_LOCUS6186 [Linum grandiflorum]
MSGEIHQHFVVVNQIQELTRRASKINFIHVYMKYNHATYYLTSIGHEILFGVYYYLILESNFLCFWNIFFIS